MLKGMQCYRWNLPIMGISSVLIFFITFIAGCSGAGPEDLGARREAMQAADEESEQLSGLDVAPMVAGGLPILIGFKNISGYMAAIIKKGVNPKEKAHVYCGAVLLQNPLDPNDRMIRYALTAAHCMRDRSKDDFQLLVGTATKIPKKGQLLNISEVLTMTDFKKVSASTNLLIYDYDVALLRIKTPIDATSKKAKKIRPIGIRFEQRDISGRDLGILGWGKTSSNMGSDVLRLGWVKSLERARCAEEFSNQGASGSWVSLRMRCAQSPPHLAVDACMGDSGGPLVGYSQDRLLAEGIVSWGPSECGDGKTGVYADLSNPDIKAWIERTAGNRSSGEL